MPKVTYQDVIYDSQGELDFKHWLDEAFEAKLIEGYRKHEKGVDTFELIEKQYYNVNGKKKHLLAGVKYTADFVVFSCNLIKDKPTNESTVYVDVKGGFSLHNDEKQFQIIRKMMLKLQGIYVHKVIPDELFLKTWVPEKCRYTQKQGRLKKKFANAPTISEYLNNNKL